MTARNDPTSSAYRTGITAKEAAEWGSVLPARGFFFFSPTHSMHRLWLLLVGYRGHGVVQFCFKC